MDLKPMKRDCGSAPEVGTVALFQGVFETWRTSWRRLPPYVSMGNLTVRQIARFLGAAVVTTCAMLNAACSGSSSNVVSTSSILRVNGACPDIEVVFARARDEPPGVGGVGQAFVDSLRSQVGGRSLGVYAVNYAAEDPAPGTSPEGAAVTSAGKGCRSGRIPL